MKLHLGCGQCHLKGYVNIDFPLSQHSVQSKSVADICVDILSLKYPRESIEEVRLHHVFEHFQRPIACALISEWYLWLKPNGLLRIEVPDFYNTAKVVLNPLAKNGEKTKAIRHLYGSHEAVWAVHCEGYTPKSLSLFLRNYGFKIIKIIKNPWKGIYNFEVFARKSNTELDVANLKQITKNYLKQFLIDESELRLLFTWMKVYENQIKKTL